MVRMDSIPAVFAVVLVGVSLSLVPCATAQPLLFLTGTIRDFDDKHKDFEGKKGDDPGIVLFDLGEDGKPVYAGQEGNKTTHGQREFDQWYRDTPGVNLSAQHSITLEPTEKPGVVRYSETSFFPIDDQLLGNQRRSHNYHFTYEIHATFPYNGGETFTFTGDDDLWVFLNGRLAIDLGGVRPAKTGSVDLDAMAGILGITSGNSYSFDLFFAERHTSKSSFIIETSIDLTNPVVPATWGSIKGVFRAD